RPQDCTIDCIRQCIPWPCLQLLGDEDPSICQHYVQAPTDVQVEFVPNLDPNSDTVVVSWKPSQYIAFLRGFQVTMQPLTGSAASCQLFLFRRNLTLSASHAEKQVYKSDPFPGLPLGSHYAITVMAVPVPERWERFYRSKIFTTRWYPKHVEVQQRGTVITVTFNLAPLSLGIKTYFTICSANGKTTYTEIAPEVKAQEEVMILSEKCKNPPRLLICYSSNDGPAHVNAVMKLGAFMQQHMATQVCLDLWDSLRMAEEGTLEWFCHRMQESDFVLVICSKGLCRKGGSSEQDLLGSELMVSLIGAEVGRAKSDGRDLSKYMAAIFNYSEEADIPTELGLVFRYRLTADLLLLFSQLHQVRLHTPGRYVKINNISEQDFAMSPSGRALQQAISDSEKAM
uniref:Si:ch211-207e14.4 n=1 Tax=Hippocampus comes TaxID=109280 RepID=A0A3Q2XN12_HIPCM